MKVRTIRKESGTYLRLPDDLREAEEVELFPLRDGYYILLKGLGAGKEETRKAEGRKPGAESRKQETAGGLTQFEAKVLAKLASIRFEKRMPSEVKGGLGRHEKEALASLERKGAITLIQSKKYPKGVYNIQKEFYPSSKKERAVPAQGATELERQLFRDGHLVVSDQNSAQRLSDVLQRQKNAVAGVKSFDGKYYVVTRAFLEKVRRILAKWKGEFVDPKAVGAKFGMHPDGVKSVLKLLAENGEFIEKGEVFFRVE